MTDLTPTPNDLEGPEHVYTNNDLGNGRRLLERWGHCLWYLPNGQRDRRWLSWNGRHWEANFGQAVRWAIEAHEYMAYQEVKNARGDDAIGKTKWNKKSTNMSRVESTLRAAATAPRVRVEASDLDRATGRIAVGNGSVDLRTGELVEPRREDLITRATEIDYHPDAESPAWDEFLRQIQPEAAVRDWLQRAVGYSLTGTLLDQVFILLHGYGANGKSTMVEALRHVFGDMAAATSGRTLVGRTDDHPEGLARLRGRRFVTVSETASGRLREEVVKQMTGGDTITARYLYGDSFEFEPVGTLWMPVNDLPTVTGSDRGIWRRLMPVPFPVTIEDDERDPYLRSKLEAEAEGILRWAVEGAVQWHERSLHEDMPEAIEAARENYREDEDHAARFLRECLEREEDAYVTNADLYAVWCEWADQQGIERGSAVGLGRRLAKHGVDSGYTRLDGRKHRVKVGLRIHPDWMSAVEDDLAF